MSISVPAIWLFGLVLVRMAGLMLTAPVLSSPLFNMKAKIGLSIAFSMLLMNTLPALSLEDVSPARMVPAMGANFLVGIAIGFAFRLVMAAATMAGELIGIQMGLGAVTLFDANADNSTALIERFLAAAFTVLFVCLDGHHHLLRAFYESFNAVSAAPQMFHAENLAGSLVQASGELLVVGCRLAAPIVIPLLLLTVVSALISRAFPQLNFISLSYSLSMLAGLALLAVSLPGLGDMVTELIGRADKNVARVIMALKE